MNRRALLVIDVQNEYFTGRLPITHPENTLPKILRAWDTAQAKGIPVIVVQHASAQPDASTFRRGSHGWELHPEIARRPADLLVPKSLPGSFTGTDLERWLREHLIDTLVITGYMTQMCCDTTSRQAVHLGFSVEFLSDATGTLAFSNAAGSVTAEELHRSILVTQQLRFANVMTTEAWIAGVSGTAASSAS